MMSALVLAGVMFIAVCAGWIARLGAALAGRVVTTSQQSLTSGKELDRRKQGCCNGKAKHLELSNRRDDLLSV